MRGDLEAGVRQPVQRPTQQESVLEDTTAQANPVEASLAPKRGARRDDRPSDGVVEAS